mmetsp:Transcript_3565/g.16290  ORF Transcript_3565/g.16290 Transcript_3565/m.16290 type:complete len:227 (-) Transcript_3565:1028-1708(-)
MSFCQYLESASIAAWSWAASTGILRGFMPSPPCTHVPIEPNATPRPKLVLTFAAPSSTWCMTASTRSAGKPSFAILSRVTWILDSTSGTSASATPLRPTAKDVSRRDEEYPVPGAKPEPSPDSSSVSWKYACGPLRSKSDATVRAKFSSSASFSLIWLTMRYATETTLCLFWSGTTGSAGTETSTFTGAVSLRSSATSSALTSMRSNLASASSWDLARVCSSGRSP